MNLPAPQAVKFLDLGSQYNLDHIDSSHLREWIIGSRVDPDIVALNVKTIHDLEVDPYTREAEFEIATRLNWHVARFGQKTREALRGWWTNGVDPSTGERMEWGRFKPDAPFINKGKTQKYASPKGVESRATFLDISERIWQRIADRYGIPIGNYTSFWCWTVECNVPIILCEGEKKAGCLLGLGYAAIALPGYRTAARKADTFGNPYHRPQLIPDLQLFATPGREVYFCFDFETKRKTVLGIRQETRKLGSLFSAAKAVPKVITLPGPDKGVDDFVVANGGEAFDLLYSNALPVYRWESRRYSQLTYEPSLELNQEKLGAFSFVGEKPKLIGVKSPKGSGKTHMLKALTDEVSERGQRVLLLVHRVQLGQEICDRVGINYVTELRSSEEGDIFGYGLCIDSLHPESQARFNADDWQDAIVIIDEAEQVIWHMLSATTDVGNHRITILKQLRQVITQALTSETGQVILLDADLTDVSIDFVLNTAQVKNWISPWILVNHYHQPNSRKCYNYPNHTPKAWFTSLDLHVEDGKHFVVTQAQKASSTWSARNLEQDLLKRHPDKRILRVDSDTIADKEHPAYGCIGNFTEIVQQYDIIIATPTIETGLSIDVYDYFTAVWGCFWGVSGANSARQALARVRDNCDRHVWAARRGVGEVGNGATSKYSLIQSQAKAAKLNINQLRQSGWDFEGDQFVTNDAALNTWAEMACRLNAEMIDYRQAVLSGLEAEGYEILSSDELEDVEVYRSLVETRDEETKAENAETVAQELVSDNKGEELQAKRTKTKEERQQLRKWKLWKRYGVEVDPDLITKDNDGWHPQIRLHYLFTIGREFAAHREQQAAAKAIQDGEIWYPTFNRGQLGAKLRFLDAVKYEDLCNPDELYSADHPAVIYAEKICKADAWAVKAIAGFTVKPDDPPMTVIQKIHRMLGNALTFAGRPGTREEKRNRLYRYIPPVDGREEVFEVWLQRDRESQAARDAQVSEASSWMAA
jgi:hypothetical protein